jgi:hypothetical protein
MSLLPDPAALHHTARQLSRQAEAVRGHAGRLRQLAPEMAWRSPAAEAFLGRLRALEGSTALAAAGIDASAAALNRHAEVIEAQCRAVEAVPGLLAGGLHLASRLLG